MRRLLSVLMILLLSQSLKAQQVRNQYQFIAEAAVPLIQLDANVGWGLQFKWLHKLAFGELTVSAGFATFGSTFQGKRSNLHTIPFMAGYRLRWKKFFIEPQIGYGELGGKEDIGGDYSRPSVGAFFYSLNYGFNFNRIDIGLRYVGANGAGASYTGNWYNKHLHYGSLFVAVNLRKSKR